MVAFEVVGRFSDAPAHFVSGITDIELVQSDGVLRVYTVTRAGGGMLAFEAGDAGPGAGLTLIDTQALESHGEVLAAPARMDQVVLNGQASVLLTGGHETQMGGFTLTGAGRYGAAVALPGSAAGVVAAQVVVQTGGETFLYANRMGSDAVSAYRIGADGQAVWIADATLPEEMQGVDVTAMVAVTLPGGTYLLALSAASDALRSYRVQADGSLLEVASLGAGGGLGIAAPTALNVVEVGGQKYALVTAAGSSSISVVALEGQGRMNLTDHVIDTLDTRFQGTGAIATVSIAGRPYIIAGGGDDGLSLFTLLPNGRLLHLGNQLREHGFPLDNITALAAKVVDGQIEVFAAGEGTGLMRLRIDPGPVAPMIQGGTGADSLQGAAAGDLIWGGLGNDTLRGWDGDDILMDGSGADSLYGGAGSDIFVMAADTSGDVIRDFQPGVDVIDLTAWGRVYSLSAVSIKVLAADRVTITFQGKVLTIHGMNGMTVPVSSFKAADLFGLWHAVGEPVFEGLRLEGTAAGETLTGNSGEDTLVGSAGADQIDGRAGFDLADYSADAGGTEVDLELSARNRGLAQGDVHIGIEGVIGGAGADVLRGTAEANMLRGNGGNDALTGREGADTLNGGAGDDALNGGAGADRLTGGAGRDIASYEDAAQGVRADLAAAVQNTGEAKGDSYADIEDLRGSEFADTLGGDGAANTLDGLAGADWIYGRGGADAIHGGAGDDTLQGDGGDDTLTGGLGVDEIVFDGGADVTVDLTLTEAQETGQGLDLILGIERVLAGEGNDRLTGDGAANRLIGGGGQDSIFGGAGADMVQGDGGSDLLDGGAGEDWLFCLGAMDMRIDLALAGGQATGLGTDTLSGFEHVLSGSGHDWLSGDGHDNELSAGGGDDQLAGGVGNDTLRGGDGADTLSGGQGNDAFVGGAGQDAVTFGGTARIAVNLNRSEAQNTGQGMDLLSGIEDVTGGSAGDQLTGNGAANRLSGAGGADRLAGGDGHDTLLGGDGADRLRGDGGDDVLSGGAGRDWLEFTGRRAISVDLGNRGLQGTGQGRDQITDVEHVLTGAGRDRLEGNAAANILQSGGGNDSLGGMAGNDRLMGGSGRDVLNGGAGRDRIDGGGGNDRMAGGAGADVFIFSGGRDAVADFSLRGGDRILIDRDDFPALRGMSERQIIHRYGEDLRNGVALDLPGQHRLVIEDLRAPKFLDDALVFI